MTKPTPENAQLAYDVYHALYDYTESFEEIGCHVAYLIGSLLSGDRLCLFAPLDESEAAFVEVMEGAFEPEHAVWQQIEIVSEGEAQ